MKKLYSMCLITLFLSLTTIQAFAQKSVTGTVSDAMGPLPGVSVLIKGTDRGLQTDENGRFTLQASPNEVIQFSMVGYATQERTIGNESVFNITMTQDNQALDEVVVTALGIRRERKSLGYALQEVQGEDLVQANEPNIANALTGKVAGLQVVRGASGAALYGSRAGNGVILITTKSGRKSNGLGITYSTTVGFESAFTTPETQNSFGQGVEGQYDAQSGSSWGPQITGQMVENWNGDQVALRAYDNVNNFFSSGVNHKHNLSFSQQYDKTSVYSSLSYLGDKSQIPGAELNRFNFLTRAVSSFGPDDRWNTDVKVNYVNSTAKNRPNGGNNNNNAFNTMYLLPRSLDITQFENSTDAIGNMI